MLPATMMPQILLGGASHPSLERRRVRGDDAVNVALPVARRLDDDQSGAARQPLLDHVPSADVVEQIENAVATEGRQHRGFHAGASQMPIRGARYARDLQGGIIGEGGRDLPLDDGATNPERAIS